MSTAPIRSHADADTTGPPQPCLGTTAHQLMAQGMPESSAYHALKRGWYCPGYNQRDYPQHDGPGALLILETPERFVRAYVLRTLAQWEIAPRPDLVEDLTQEGLLACWTRRHAPHIQNFPRYYAAMLRGWSRSTASGSSASRRSWCRSRTIQEVWHDRVLAVPRPAPISTPDTIWARVLTSPGGSPSTAGGGVLAAQVVTSRALAGSSPAPGVAARSER